MFEPSETATIPYGMLPSDVRKKVDKICKGRTCDRCPLSAMCATQFTILGIDLVYKAEFIPYDISVTDDDILTVFKGD